MLRRAAINPLFPGYWHCVNGKIEQGETPRETIIREVEVGRDIEPELGTVISVKAKNFQNPNLIWRDLSLFFIVKNLNQEPVNQEPRLHDSMDWFDVKHLPIPVVKCGTEHYL